jgi:hypothetical protein
MDALFAEWSRKQNQKTAQVATLQPTEKEVDPEVLGERIGKEVRSTNSPDAWVQISKKYEREFGSEVIRETMLSDAYNEEAYEHVMELLSDWAFYAPEMPLSDLEKFYALSSIIDLLEYASSGVLKYVFSIVEPLASAMIKAVYNGVVQHSVSFAAQGLESFRELQQKVGSLDAFFKKVHDGKASLSEIETLADASQLEGPWLVLLKAVIDVDKLLPANANNIDQLIMALDHLMDLEHNGGLILGSYVQVIGRADQDPLVEKEILQFLSDKTHKWTIEDIKNRTPEIYNVLQYLKPYRRAKVKSFTKTAQVKPGESLQKNINIQSPRVEVDPTIAAEIKDAIEKITAADPNYFVGVSKIVALHGGPFGQVSSEDPSVVHLNIQRIINEVKSKFGTFNANNPEHREAMEEAVQRVLIEVISHEKGHVLDWNPEQHKFPGGEGPAQQESHKIIKRLFPQSSVKGFCKTARLFTRHQLLLHTAGPQKLFDNFLNYYWPAMKEQELKRIRQESFVKDEDINWNDIMVDVWEQYTNEIQDYSTEQKWESKRIDRFLEQLDNLFMSHTEKAASVKGFCKTAQQKLTIGIDIDDVLADFHQVMWALAEKHVPIDEEDKKQYVIQDTKHGSLDLRDKIMEEMYQKRLIANMPEIPGAVEEVNKWHDAGHKIVLITARSKGWEDQTKEWLDKVGLKYDKLIITNHQDKAKFAEDEGVNIFIDDSVNFLENMADKGIKVYVFDQPWNTELAVPRIRGWRKVKASVKMAQDMSMDSAKILEDLNDQVYLLKDRSDKYPVFTTALKTLQANPTPQGVQNLTKKVQEELRKFNLHGKTEEEKAKDEKAKIVERITAFKREFFAAYPKYAFGTPTEQQQLQQTKDWADKEVKRLIDLVEQDKFQEEDLTNLQHQVVEKITQRFGSEFKQSMERRADEEARRRIGEIPKGGKIFTLSGPEIPRHADHLSALYGADNIVVAENDPLTYQQMLFNNKYTSHAKIPVDNLLSEDGFEVLKHTGFYYIDWDTVFGLDKTIPPLVDALSEMPRIHELKRIDITLVSRDPSAYPTYKSRFGNENLFQDIQNAATRHRTPGDDMVISLHQAYLKTYFNQLLREKGVPIVVSIIMAEPYRGKGGGGMFMATFEVRSTKKQVSSSVKGFTKFSSPRWSPEEKARLKDLYLKYRQRGIPHHIIYKAAAYLLNKSWLAVKQKLESMYGLEDELKGMKFEHWDKNKIDQTIQDLYRGGKPISRLRLPPNLMYQISNHSLPKSQTRNFPTYYNSFDDAMANNILIVGVERDGDKLIEKPIKTLEDALKYYRRKEKMCHTWSEDEIIELLQEAHTAGLPLTYSFFRSHPDIYKPLLGVGRSLEGLRDSIKRLGYTWSSLVVMAAPEYADFYSEDGRLIPSTEELRVRRFLELNNIPFRVACDQDRLPVEDPELQNLGYKHFIPDFVVLGTDGNVQAYVEVFGSIADSRAANTSELYREKKKAKEKFYSTLPYKFIAINNNTDGVDLTDEILKEKFGSFLGA